MTGRGKQLGMMGVKDDLCKYKNQRMQVQQCNKNRRT